jgi:hypothetical protein
MWMNVIGTGIGIGRHGESRVEGGRSGGVGVKVMTPASGATDYLGKRDERAQEELPRLVLILAEQNSTYRK